MIVLKFPHAKKEKKIHIKAKCPCGTKVLINDISDIVYMGHSTYIGLFRDPEADFGYMCPNCEEICKLSDNANYKIANALRKQGINMAKYNSICSSVDHRIGTYEWEKALGITNKTLSQYIISNGILDNIEYLYKNNLPLPANLYEYSLTDEFKNIY